MYLNACMHAANFASVTRFIHLEDLYVLYLCGYEVFIYSFCVLFETMIRMFQSCDSIENTCFSALVGGSLVHVKHTVLAQNVTKVTCNAQDAERMLLTNQCY